MRWPPGRRSCWPSLLLVTAGPFPVRLVDGQQIPRAEQHYRLGLDLEKVGKYHEAAAEFARAIEIKPEFSDAYYHFGLSTLQDGDAQEAIRGLMRLMQLEPNNNQARIALGQIYFGPGYLDDALASYYRAL